MGNRDYIKLHCLGEQWNVSLPVIQEMEHYSEGQMYDMLFDEYKRFRDELIKNRIDYDKLKSALIPPDGKDNYDFLFIFSYSMCEEQWILPYSMRPIFNVMVNKEFEASKNSIFSGDFLNKCTNDKRLVKYIQNRLIKDFQPLENDYYFILVSNLSINQRSIIHNRLLDEKCYIDSIDVTLRDDLLKLTLMLPSVGLKYNKRFIIPSAEEGYTSILERIVPKQLEIVYVREDWYSIFLTYNYQSYVYPCVKDYALNILNHINPQEIKNYKLIIEEKKYEEYIKKNKAHVIKLLSNKNINEITLCDFTSLVKESLSNNIFNIEINQHLTKFNTILDMNSKRLFFSFECDNKKKIIRLITAY